MNSSISKILINSSRQNIYAALSSHVVVTFSLFVFFFLALLSPVGAQPTPDANLDSYQYKFSPSMAVIVVILIAALFFMAFFAFYIRHCSDSHSVGNSIRNLAGRSRRGMRGLDPSVIETFPTLVYSAVKEHKVGKGALECAVCLNEFEDDETLRLLPKCDHVFHPECIDAWLGSHTTCPVCRANLSPDQSGESGNQLADSNTELDLESQNDTVPPTGEPQQHLQEEEEQPQAVEAQVLNRSRTRGRSRSSRIRRVFPRSNSTGHSLVQPGECTERFTLRLPVEIRKQIMNRKLNRATSMVVLPRESSSRRGGVNGGDGEGSSRGRSYRRLKSLEPRVKSERWVLSKTAPFFMRMLSMKSPSPKGTSSNAEERDGGQGGKASEPGRPPV